jgi:hypothetical protein
LDGAVAEEAEEESEESAVPVRRDSRRFSDPPVKTPAAAVFRCEARGNSNSS